MACRQVPTRPPPVGELADQLLASSQAAEAGRFRLAESSRLAEHNPQAVLAGRDGLPVAGVGRGFPGQLQSQGKCLSQRLLRLTETALRSETKAAVIEAVSQVEAVSGVGG